MGPPTQPTLSKFSYGWVSGPIQKTRLAQVPKTESFAMTYASFWWMKYLIYQKYGSPNPTESQIVGSLDPSKKFQKKLLDGYPYPSK